MPSAARDELEHKTKLLYAQQSFVARNSSFQQGLMNHLKKVQNLFSQTGKSRPVCNISYAWPSIENKDKEYWL